MGRRRSARAPSAGGPGTASSSGARVAGVGDRPAEAGRVRLHHPRRPSLIAHRVPFGASRKSRPVQPRSSRCQRSYGEQGFAPMPALEVDLFTIDRQTAVETK